MTIIELSEDISVKNIKSFYLQLKDKLSNAQEITLDFSRVKRADLSLMQVIMEADRESRKLGKRISLQSVSDDIKNQLYFCGLLKCL